MNKSASRVNLGIVDLIAKAFITCNLCVISLVLFTPTLTLATDTPAADSGSKLSQLSLPQDLPVPGGLKVLPLPDNNPGPWLFQNASVLTLERAQRLWAIIAIPLATKAGMHKICLSNQPLCLKFKIHQKRYQEQHIELATNRRVQLSKKDLKRHNQEKQITAKAFNNKRTKTAETEFLWPTAGPISSEFGLKRFYNGVARNPHSGIDIAAPKGSEVRSPAKGQVVLTGNFFFNGKTVFVNHGDALVSMFCHLDQIHVNQGDQVDTGNLLGTVGSSGRATGAHLHWSLSLRNVRIDPRLWLKDTLASLSQAAPQ